MTAYSQQFTGDGYLRSPTAIWAESPAYTTPVTAGTVLLWFKANSAANQTRELFSRAFLTPVTNRSIRIRLQQSPYPISAILSEDGTGWQRQITTGNVTLSQWTFIAVSFASGGGTFSSYLGNEGAPSYVKLDDASGTVTSFNNPSQPGTLGADNNGAASFYLDGLIGNCVMWHRQLTDNEMTYCYNGGAGRNFNFYQGDTVGPNNPGVADMDHYWGMADQEPSNVLDLVSNEWDLVRDAASTGTVVRSVDGHIDEADVPTPAPTSGQGGYAAFRSPLIR